MHDDPTSSIGSDPAELDAYNAAFYELGLRWHWDAATYQALQSRHEDGATRVRHYLETQQPHLLRAYDPEFLVEMIEQKKCAAHRAASRIRPSGTPPFDVLRLGPGTRLRTGHLSLRAPARTVGAPVSP